MPQDTDPRLFIMIAKNLSDPRDAVNATFLPVFYRPTSRLHRSGGDRAIRVSHRGRDRTHLGHHPSSRFLVVLEIIRIDCSVIVWVLSLLLESDGKLDGDPGYPAEEMYPVELFH